MVATAHYLSSKIISWLEGGNKKLLIAGWWVEAATGKTFETRNPATGDLLARVAEGDEEDVDRAVAAGRRAFDSGSWPRLVAAIGRPHGQMGEQVVRQGRAAWRRVRCGRVVALLLYVPGLGVGYWRGPAAAAQGPIAPATHPAAPYTPTLVGKVVRVEVSGFEPDFDPIRRVIISASLRDRRTAHPLPDTMLVLSSYVELFQPGTTPVLPDLLHPDQIATSLGGFMQGKAALVNASGQTVYNGTLLGEIFLDNSVDLLVDLNPVHGGPIAPTVRLKGRFVLNKDRSVRGNLQAPTGGQLSGLAAPVKAAVPWQRVVDGLTVHPPAMMGTSSGGKASSPTLHSALNPTSAVSATTPVITLRTLYFAGGAVLALLGVMLLWAPWQRKAGATRVSGDNSPTPSTPAGAPDPQ